jgi:hypothetical protein
MVLLECDGSNQGGYFRDRVNTGSMEIREIFAFGEP